MKPYCMISNAKTFAFSAENPTGARAGGSKGGDCTKLSPTVAIRAGETVTLVDTDGPGMIQSIWFTGYIGHSFVIRMYWDNCEYPSVEAPISAFSEPHTMRILWTGMENTRCSTPHRSWWLPDGD